MDWMNSKHWFENGNVKDISITKKDMHSASLLFNNKYRISVTNKCKQ